MPGLRGERRATADYFLAMALSEIGEEDEARAILRRAVQWHLAARTNPAGDDLWHAQLDWIRAEAEALLASE